MSANKYQTTTLLVLLMTSFFPLFSQNDVSIDNNIVSSSEENPQFLLRTEHNGKTKYVECAMQNVYFHKATVSTPEETIVQNSEFTAKGGESAEEDYFGYTFFLVQDGKIMACNESGIFRHQPGGRYTLSRFSHPLSISPKSFEGKEFNTIDNHPLFEKDDSLYNMTIRLSNPKNQEPVLSTEPADPTEENILGQIQAKVVPINN